MSGPAHDESGAHRPDFAASGELAARVFTIAIVGVFAAILLLIIIADR